MNEKPTMIISLLLIFAGMLGYITLFIILFGYKTNKIINIYLVIILFLMSSRFLFIGINGLINNDFIQPIIRSFNVFFIFLAPCFYLYFKNLITSQKNFIPKDLFHFLIPLLFIFESRFSILKNLLNIPFSFIYLFYTLL